MEQRAYFLGLAREVVLALGSGLCRVSRLRGEALASDWEETKGIRWQDLSTHR